MSAFTNGTGAARAQRPAAILDLTCAKCKRQVGPHLFHRRIEGDTVCVECEPLAPAPARKKGLADWWPDRYRWAECVQCGTRISWARTFDEIYDGEPVMPPLCSPHRSEYIEEQINLTAAAMYDAGYEDARSHLPSTRSRLFEERHEEPPPPDWLDGTPMDPWAEIPSRLDPLPGFPFLHEGASALICGPTGGGRSSLIQACAYDGAKKGLGVLYLGGEVTEDEFNVRARLLADKRGDGIEVRERLELVRYVDLTSTLRSAWSNADEWKQAGERYAVVIIDPLNDALAATSRKHENQDYIEFYGRVVKPLLDGGAGVIMLDNVGHAEDAQERAIGPSSKQHKADLTFHCKALDGPRRLQLITDKVRSVRCPFRKGTAWECDENTQTIKPVFRSSGSGKRKTKTQQKQDEQRTKLLLVLTLEEQSVAALSRATGVARSTLDRRLLALENEVLAEEGAAGWKLTVGGAQLSSSLRSGQVGTPQDEALVEEVEL